MNTEQKAEAYDKAIRKAKITLDCCGSASIATKNTVYNIFPELKESEDEQIRKEIIAILQYKYEKYSKDPKYCNAPQWIAWLEKQGKESPEKEFTFKALPRLLEMIEVSDRAKAYTEKLAVALDNEGYHTDAKIVRESIKIMNGEEVPMATMDEDEKTRKEIVGYLKKNLRLEWATWLEKQGEKKCIDDLTQQEAMDIAVAKCFEQGEQKPAWSEEDKNRVHPKQEWSKEDEKRVNRISDFIWKNRKGDTDEIYQQEQDANWIKSLKQRYTWKPSKEQMIALRQVISGCSYDIEPLLELETKLKEF